ncbi:HlyD family secretion protein [uncultured Barnesiella sp.]|uniref:HlyD family secretion protein n=1 Tax=uncultured Barnesiella sp. TaxID=584861 RepID=UPI002626103C|nr:HlyD family secretion protein [uncultured Barnesiella sp.]
MNKRTKKIGRNIVVIAIILVGLGWVCSRFIHLGRVEYTDNAQIRRNIIPINSRVQGYIQKVCFDDFQFVHKGDTLVVIESSEYRLKVVQAKANYQKALMENSAMETVISTTANNLTVSDANIEELRIRLNQAKTDFHRYEQLYAQKAVTRQQYDNAKADYEATRAKYDMLVRQKRSTSLVKDEQTQRLEQNQTNIEVAQAAQHLAELNLSYTVIVAPCNGVTSKRAIQEGQLIQPGQTLLSVVDHDSVWVIANYKDTQTRHIDEGMPVDIEVDAVPGITYQGRVATLSSATGAQYSIIPQDNSAGNFVKVEQRIPIKIVFTGENRREDMDRLRSGMNVECEVNY